MATNHGLDNFSRVPVLTYTAREGMPAGRFDVGGYAPDIAATFAIFPDFVGHSSDPNRRIVCRSYPASACPVTVDRFLARRLCDWDQPSLIRCCRLHLNVDFGSTLKSPIH